MDNIPEPQPLPTHRFRNITGQRFNQLTVLHFAGRDVRGKLLWCCECDCGTRIVARGTHVTTGNTHSCKCKVLALHTTHGETHSAEYRSWQNIKTRTSNPNNLHYHNYGGRGISMCPEWKRSFSTFLADMGYMPGPGYTIERKDNDGNYEPKNCCWATRLEQAKNCRSNLLLTHKGQTKTAKDWARVVGLSPPTLYSRIRAGWTTERALETPAKKSRR